MSGRRILVLGCYPAVEPRHGGQIRLAQLIAACRARRFEVKQASFFPAHPFYMERARGTADVGLPLEPLQAWRGIRAPLIEDLASGEYVASEPALLEALEKQSGPVDFVCLEQPWLLPVVHKLRERGRLGDFQLLYGSQNIERSLKAAIFQQYAVTTGEPLLQAIDDLEQQAARESVLVAAVTESDAQVLRTWTSAPVILSPNGIAPWRSSEAERAQWTARLGNEPFALYVASAHPPNVSGLAESFGESLAPLSPAQRLVIAGSVGEHVLQSPWFRRWDALNRRRTVVTGMLSDDSLSALRDLAHTFVLPMTSGGGSNLKTAEALYAGRHVVATPLSMRGFEHLADLPGVQVVPPGAGFARAVARSLAEPPPAADPASAERRESLTWSRTLAPWCDALENLAAR